MPSDRILGLRPAEGDPMLAGKVPIAELAQRRARLTDKVRDRALDGIVVWSRGGPAVDYYGDVLYLTNHFPPISSAEPDTELWSGRSYTALILPVDGEPVLVVDIPTYDRDLVDIEDVRTPMHVAEGVASVLKETGLAKGRLGLAGHHVYLASQDQTITETLGHRISWTACDDILASMRMVKSDAEVEAMREAADVGVGWMSSMRDAAVPGATEGEIAGEGLKFLAEHGGIPADIDIASGPTGHLLKSRSAIPTWNPGRVLERGDLFHVDGWGSVGGYYTDTVRTTIVDGTPNTDQLRIIDGTISLIEHLIEGFVPGVSCSEINSRGMKWLRDNAFADSLPDESVEGGADKLHFDTWPYFGHGIGLGIEPPWLTAENNTVLVPNMVFAIEVYLDSAGVGLAGFEQNVVVQEGGAEVLTKDLRPRWWE